VYAGVCGGGGVCCGLGGVVVVLPVGVVWD